MRMTTKLLTAATTVLVSLGLGACTTEPATEPAAATVEATQPAPPPTTPAPAPAATTPTPVATTPAPIAPATPEEAFYAQFVQDYPLAQFVTQADSTPVGWSVCDILDLAAGNPTLTTYGLDQLMGGLDSTTDPAMVYAVVQAAADNLCPAWSAAAGEWLVAQGQ